MGNKFSQTTDREKAVFILGMVRAFNATKWPKRFNKNDKTSWLIRARWAEHMITGGAYNPFNVWEVRKLANEEMELPHATD